MSNTNFFPTTPADVKKFKDIKYLEGLPREYRFNAKTGVLYQGADLPITKPGETFSLIPIAYRLFSAGLFGKDEKPWIELFFINNRGHVSVIMFHGFSVDAIRETMAGLFYEDAQLTETVLSVVPVPKMSKDGPYYIATFKAEPLPDKERNFSNELSDTLPAIFQYKTAEVHTHTSVSVNMPMLGSGEDETPLIDQAGE